ncbi:MAG TPA: hypothetical protein PK263_02745 [bacterium]|nr:hypothetical protein [bacterium]
MKKIPESSPREEVAAEVAPNPKAPETAGELLGYAETRVVQVNESAAAVISAGNETFGSLVKSEKPERDDIETAQAGLNAVAREVDELSRVTSCRIEAEVSGGYGVSVPGEEPVVVDSSFETAFAGEPPRVAADAPVRPGMAQSESADSSPLSGTTEATLSGDAGVADPPSPNYLEEDKRYLAIKAEISSAAAESNGVLSPQHQDVLFGDPTAFQRGEKPRDLDQRAQQLFAERYPDAASQYLAAERTRVYDSINGDPAFQALGEETTRITNQDLAQARSGDWGQAAAAEANSPSRHSGLSQRVSNRVEFQQLRDFVKTYPEKAAGYAVRWDQFVAEHPEVAKMSNDQWFKWCDQNSGGWGIDKYRQIARLAEPTVPKPEPEARRAPMESVTRQSTTEVAGPGASEPGRSEELGFTETDTEVDEEYWGTEEEIIDSEEAMATILAGLEKAGEISEDELIAHKEELGALPYLSGSDADILLGQRGKDLGLRMVKTKAIAGSMSSAFNDWGTEYADREGRPVAVAKELLSGDQAQIEEVFHLNKSNERVKLKKIAGPAGELYFTEDGSHRVAGCKLINLPELPADVEDLSGISEIATTDSNLAMEWDERINAGLITGVVEEIRDASRQTHYKLKIETQTLPWMVLPEAQLAKFNRFYEQAYPGGLDKVKSLKGERRVIPKAALLNENGVALNFYMHGRWDEYLQRHGDGASRQSK